MRTCRKIILVAAVLLAANGFCGVGATEAWVMNYVSNVIAQATTTYSNGVTTITANGYTMTIESPTETAIRIKDASAAAVNAGYATDMELAFDRGRWAYVAGAIVMPCTPSNITCTVDGTVYCTTVIGRQTWMVPQSKLADKTYSASDKLMRIVSTKVPASIAEELIGN